VFLESIRGGFAPINGVEPILEGYPTLNAEMVSLAPIMRGGFAPINGVEP